MSLWHVPGNCFMGSRRRHARKSSGLGLLQAFLPVRRKPSLALFIRFRHCPHTHPVRTIFWCSFAVGTRHLPGRSRRRHAFSLVAARFYVSRVLAPRFYVRLSLQVLPTKRGWRHQGKALTRAKPLQIRAPATRPWHARRAFGGNRRLYTGAPAAGPPGR